MCEERYENVDAVLCRAADGRANVAVNLGRCLLALVLCSFYVALNYVVLVHCWYFDSVVLV